MVDSFPSTRAVSFAAVIFGVVIFSGCGGSVADVSGTVKMDGKPLPDADLVFTPEGDGERVFYALSVEGGEFQVDYGQEKGMPPGKYTITVTWYTLPDGKPLPPGEAGADFKTSGKVREHSQELSREITSGNNPLSLDVSKD